MKKSYDRKTVLHGILILMLVGGVSYAIENFGEGHLTALTGWIEKSGHFAPVVFILLNILGIVLAFPQTLFTVVAGVLFGAIKGTAMCLISMALGGTISFMLGRFVFRGRILKKFSSDPNFMRLEMLSRRHPLKVLALSRIVPVVPYAVANYLWSVTKVRYIPFIIMSVLCLIPETVFLTAGGHILSTGVVNGSFNWRLLIVLVGAGALIFFLVKAVRRSLEEDTDA